MAKPIRILLVDDHAVVRQALAMLLRGEGDVEVVGEAGDGQRGVDLACALLPDVVLMDINMPVMNGIDATRLIRAACADVCVIGLSIAEQADALLGAGAAAFVSKTAAPEVLLAAIRASQGPPAAPALS